MRSRRISITSKSSHQEEALINLMPLIDVVFVVLVMFILIAPMMNGERIQLPTGTKEIKKSQLSNELAVYVRQDNTIWVNQRPYQKEELLNYLKEQKKKAFPQSFQLLCDERASYGTFQIVKEIGKKAGFEEVEVINQPK